MSALTRGTSTKNKRVERKKGVMLEVSRRKPVFRRGLEGVGRLYTTRSDD